MKKITLLIIALLITNKNNETIENQIIDHDKKNLLEIEKKEIMNKLTALKETIMTVENNKEIEIN